MKRLALIGLLLLAGVLAGIWLTQRPAVVAVSENTPAPPPRIPPEKTATGTVSISISTPSATAPGPAPFLGETILAGYAQTNLPPENDLTLMARLMENSLLLLKSAGNRPLSANEDWADLLRGRNAAAERFLPDGHVALNAKGQLVDRWQTPLFFHALGGGRHEIRSAGPDRELWSEDDLHRNYDGRFRRGEDLSPGSLLEDANRR